MAVPSSYTEKSLAEFMHAALGKVAEALDLHFSPEDAGDYAEAVNDALVAYGVDEIADATDIPKIRALARRAAWQFVVANFAALYDFSADGASYSRSQLLKNAQAALAVADEACLTYAATYAAQIVAIDHIHDPYRVRPEEDSAL